MSALSFITTTIPSFFKKKETLLYPIQTKDLREPVKGKITIYENDCILCGKCQKTCPCDAIIVERQNKTWSIDHFKCITCRSCVEACPKKCLSMDPSLPSISRNKHLEEHNISSTKEEE